MDNTQYLIHLLDKNVTIRDESRVPYKHLLLLHLHLVSHYINLKTFRKHAIKTDLNILRNILNILSQNYNITKYMVWYLTLQCPPNHAFLLSLSVSCAQKNSVKGVASDSSTL